MTQPDRAPRVWLDLTQAELDAAYDQSHYAPNMAQLLQRYASASEATRERLGLPQQRAYGPSATETLDLYRCAQAGAPTLVFLHGGAWRSGRAHDYAFMAELFVSSGAHLVVPDFASVLDAGGNLIVLAEQVRRALAWVYREATSWGGDAERIYLCGHSSGAHLAAVALTTDWPQASDLPSNLIKGGLCCSGMYELRPVRLSARSGYVKFDDPTEQALSPQRHLRHLNAPLVVACGSLETPEFQRQARDFVDATRAAGKPAELLLAPDYNHFEIVETLASPFGLLGRAMLQLMEPDLRRAS